MAAWSGCHQKVMPLGARPRLVRVDEPVPTGVWSRLQGDAASVPVRGVDEIDHAANGEVIRVVCRLAPDRSSCPVAEAGGAAHRELEESQEIGCQNSKTSWRHARYKP